MDIIDRSFLNFLESMEIQKYKIKFCRVEGKPYIYVKTSGLTKIGMKEIFTISKSPELEDAAILLRLLVRRLIDTGQKVGVRKDLIRHPIEGYQLRYLVKECREEMETLVVIAPDENNLLPGELGFNRFL